MKGKKVKEVEISIHDISNCKGAEEGKFSKLGTENKLDLGSASVTTETQIKTIFKVHRKPLRINTEPDNTSCLEALEIHSNNSESSKDLNKNSKNCNENIKKGGLGKFTFIYILLISYC